MMEQATAARSVDVVLGTYPKDAEPGSGEGMWSARFDRVTGIISDLRQVAQVAAPSFLATTVVSNTRMVYAVSEVPTGQVHGFALREGGVEQRGVVDTMGSQPCHVVVDGDGVLVANYGTGSVATFPVGEHLTKETPVALFQHSGSGPRPDRQEGPHAHYVTSVPATQYMWAVDLGSDAVFLYEGIVKPDGTRGFAARGIAVDLPAGTGPRHVAWDDRGLAYIVGELDRHITVVRPHLSDGSGTILGRFPCGDWDTGREEESESLPSHIAMSTSGRRIYTTVRGRDMLLFWDLPELGEAMDEADGENADVIPCLRGTYRLAGHWPRHFAVVAADDGGDFLLIAQQGSHEIEVLHVATDGVVTQRQSAPIPAPACVVVVD